MNRLGLILLAFGTGALLGWRFPLNDSPHASAPSPISVPAAQSSPSTPAVIPAAEHRPLQPFHWSQVESADYLVYIANLRAIGCPDLTVRDIIIADVTQLFAPRYTALISHAPTLAWWARSAKGHTSTSDLALETQIQALNHEKRQLIQRLLGNDALGDLVMPEVTAVSLRENNTWAYLPAAKQAVLKQILTHYNAVLEWGQSQWKGLSSDDRDAREKEVYAARLQELAKLLNPAELADFQLRDSPTARAIREQLGQADLTEAEFRKLYELRSAFEQQNPEPGKEDWKRLEEDYSRTLGSDRFAELQRQNDPLWRAMQDLGADQSIGQETMQQAYEVQRLYSEKMVQAVGTLFADPQQGPQPLRDLASEMEGKLSSILGSEVVERLDRRGVLPRLVVQDDGKRKNYSFSRGAFAE